MVESSKVRYRLDNDQVDRVVLSEFADQVYTLSTELHESVVAAVGDANVSAAARAITKTVIGTAAFGVDSGPSRLSKRLKLEGNSRERLTRDDAVKIVDALERNLRCQCDEAKKYGVAADADALLREIGKRIGVADNDDVVMCTCRLLPLADFESGVGESVPDLSLWPTSLDAFDKVYSLEMQDRAREIVNGLAAYSFDGWRASERLRVVRLLVSAAGQFLPHHGGAGAVHRKADELLVRVGADELATDESLDERERLQAVSAALRSISIPIAPIGGSPFNCQRIAESGSRLARDLWNRADKRLADAIAIAERCFDDTVGTELLLACDEYISLAARLGVLSGSRLGRDLAEIAERRLKELTERVPGAPGLAAFQIVRATAFGRLAEASEIAERAALSRVGDEMGSFPTAFAACAITLRHKLDPFASIEPELLRLAAAFAADPVAQVMYESIAPTIPAWVLSNSDGMRLLSG